jgi:hypothetical protein
VIGLLHLKQFVPVKLQNLFFQEAVDAKSFRLPVPQVLEAFAYIQ